jgi:hypothetical protein
MGLTQKLGTIPLAILTDASNNVGIGASPSGSYKLEVTGTAKVSSTLLLGGALTGTSATFSSGGTSNAGFFTINDGTTTLGNSFAVVHRNANDGNGRFSLTRWQVQNTSGLEQSAFIGAQAVTGASNYSPNLILGVSTGVSTYSTYLTIVSTGAATFSSSVTASSSTTGTQVMANFAAANYGSPSSRTYIQIGTQYGDGSSRIGSINTTGNQSALVFQSHSATADVWNDAMYINGTGNVGIGTASPNERLYVYNNAGTNPTGTVISVETAGSTAGYGAEVKLINSNSSGRTYGIRSSGPGDGLVGSYKFAIIDYTANAGRLIIDSSGVVQISALTSNGTVSTQSSNGSLYVSSDANLKIEDGFVENGLEKVLALKPRYFYWKDKEAFSADRQLGFYAQEVNAVSEEIANTPPEGCGWGIYDRGLVALLTAAIQEQQAQIEELNERLNKAGL